MAWQSAIVLPVDAAESAVKELRQKHDPACQQGLPAHLTVLFPFMPAPQCLDEVGALRDVFARVTAFDFSLADVGRFERTAYLKPDQPDRFIALTNTIAQRWPAFPPYAGAFSEVVPHLTVADDVDEAVIDIVQRALTPRLPIACRATEAWLLTSDGSGVWSRAHVLPFAP